MRATDAQEGDDLAGGNGSERTCILSRVAQPKDGLIRFVHGPDGTLTPDIAQKLPGRGVWVTGTAAALAEAMRRKLFARALRRQPGEVVVPAMLVADVDVLLERRALQALSLANKAGCVVSGAAKVETAIAKGNVGAVVHARDGSPDGARKIGQVLRRSGYIDIAAINLFGGVQLDLALGRPNVIHAALTSGGACTEFLARCRRLALFRTGPPQPPTDTLSDTAADKRGHHDMGVAGRDGRATRSGTGDARGHENE